MFSQASVPFVPSASPTFIKSCSLKELRDYAETLGEKPYRGEQVYQWLNKFLIHSFEQMSNLPQSFLSQLKESFCLQSLIIDKKLISEDGTTKFRFRTWDNYSIEAVYIPQSSAEHKNTLCISSQVGCAMNCHFCYTATLGLKRHLEPAEIIEQVTLVLADLMKDRITEYGEKGFPLKNDHHQLITNIVFMGMGEPLHNIDNIIKAIQILTHEQGLNFSSRKITVSTSGIIPAIQRLMTETKVCLAVSLNASNNEIRTQIMPVSKKYPLKDLIDTCKNLHLDRKRRVFFEYVMLGNINDSKEHVIELIHLLKGFKCKVNLIPWNPFDGVSYTSPHPDNVDMFFQALHQAHIFVSVRKTRGQDIYAACGQLANANV